MTITVAPGDPAEAVDLLRASHALLDSLFPSDANHYLSFEDLKAPNIRFLIARAGNGPPLGCVALVIHGDYAEIKSMFVADEARGQGVGDAIMQKIEAVARAERIAVLRVETGPPLRAAYRLYTRHGLVERGPFGHYVASPHSQFMEKTL